MPRIRVSYTGPTNFLASDQWIQIRTQLDSHLPLRSLHWKPPSSPDALPRRIDELEVDFVTLESIKEEGSSQVPSSLLERPLMNLFVFACEDNETYRTQFKKQVKDWQSFISTKRHQEWLVILVIRPDSRPTGTSRIFSMRAPVLDKVKVDINIDKKRDRCVELAWPVGMDDTAQWSDLVGKLRDGVMTAFDGLVGMRQEEIEKSEGQRLMPGWNFCTYFILKESLAASFEGVDLLDEALQQYQELEQSFFQALREKNLPWFGNLGGISPGDDSRSILDITQKPYRDHILNNTVTLFDFRIYLSACQMILLAKQERILDVISKSHMFIVSFGRSLKENERSFTTFFLESWIYSSCMNIVLHCDEALEKFQLLKGNNGFMVQYAAKKGELIDLARNQLDKIGIHLGFLPNSAPFSLCSPSITPKFADGKPVSSKITRTELVEILGDKAKFDDLYVKTTQRAIELYAEGKRRKFALKLHGDLAAFDQLRDQHPTAHQTFSSLPAHYTSQKHKWPPLESFMLARSLDSHQKAGMTKDKPWLESVLAFLGLCAQGFDGDGLNPKDGSEGENMVDTEKRKEYLSELLKDARAVADTLDEDLMRPDYPAISMHLAEGDAHLADDQDGSYIHVVLRNLLPCEVKLDQISMVVSEQEDETFTFMTKDVVAQPGANSITLSCPDSHSGIFRVSSSSVQLSKIHFTYLYTTQDGSSQPPPVSPMTGQLASHTIPGSNQWMVKIPVDRRAVDVKMALPRVIQWDTKPRVMLEVHSGRNTLEEAVITISNPSDVKFRMEDAELLFDSLGDESAATIMTSVAGITLHSIHPDQVVSFSIPHSTASAGNVLFASITVSYQVASPSSETQPRRTFKAVRKVSTALPLQVSVMDSFRGKTLISKFTVSSTSHLQVRIKDTKLTGGTGLKITAPRPGRGSVSTMVTPQRPAHFLYQLESQAPRYERESLHFHVKYRTMREEIEKRLEAETRRALEGKGEDSEGGDLVERVKGKLIGALAGDASWVSGYIYAGELDLKGTAALLDGEEEDVKGAVSSVLRKLKEEPFDGIEEEGEEGEWHELIIPVDLPFMHILCAIQILVVSDVDSIYAGQPVSARAEINTSFHWGSIRKEGDEELEYSMRYSVQESVTDWLISGHKRGDFTAKEDGIHTVELTLVPLHHGELSLPKIVIQPLSTAPIPGSGTGAQNSLPSVETYHVHAAQRVMVLPRGGRSTFVVGMGM